MSSFHQLVEEVLADTLGPSLSAFLPEVALCATIVMLLLVRMIAGRWQGNAFLVAMVGTAAALFLAIPWNLIGSAEPFEPTATFTGLLVFDGFSVYMRVLLLFFTLLFGSFTLASGVPDRENATEFYVLVLGAVLGMCLMISANHMLVVFLGMEMASVPSYVLAGMLRRKRTSSEAALKYAVFGAGAAGVMLYGISLLVGALGSAHLPTMALQLAEVLETGDGQRTVLLALGGLMVMVGLAFKLSAVPFHFWAPDVFEGATAEVAAFLSIASKAAALGLLIRVTLGLVSVADSTAMAALEPARVYVVGLVGLLAAVTCTFGNLAAYGQTNIKRMLGYSTIAHAGYMMMAVVAAVALIDEDVEGASHAVAALGFYLAVYLFMNLGAFAIVAFLRNAIGSEEIADYAGLVRRSPGLVVCMGVILFSLVGMPPLAGFAAKFTVFASLFDARLLLLLVIGGANTALSLFYYLRVLKVMTMDPEPKERAAPTIPLVSAAGAYCAVLTVPLVVLFILWDALFAWAAASSATSLFLL